mgnify:CR=1 FL=1
MKGILTTLSAALASVLLLTFCTGREPVISSDPEFNFRKHKMDSIATNTASTDELNDLVKASGEFSGSISEFKEEYRKKTYNEWNTATKIQYSTTSSGKLSIVYNEETFAEAN